MQSNEADKQRVVTRQDIAGALVSLSPLVKRVALDPEIEFAGYLAGLRSVRYLDLVAAVQAILEGALGHGFFPTPPELRIECNRAFDRRHADDVREARRREMAEQIATRNDLPKRTPEGRERVAKLMREFNMRWEIERTKEPPLDEVRARLGDEALRRLPNQPTTSEAWRRYETRLALEAARAAQARSDHHTGG